MSIVSSASGDEPTAAPARVGWVEWLKSHPNVIRVFSVTAFFAWWEYAGRDANPLFMTYPSAIFRAAWTLTESGELPQAFIASMIPFLLGLVISIVGGIIIGIIIGQVWILEYLLDPFLNALYAIPRVALIPLIILWAGLETTGKVVVITSIAIFPVIVNTYSGIKDVRGNLIEIGRAYGATELQIFSKIILPASVPYIMAGIRLAVGLAIIGFIVAEFFTAITGLGGIIVLYANNFATAKLFVPIIVTGILGIALSELVAAIERRLSRWRKSERERF
jgi:ABC-type nitrate/sulfonate/bicarbonate transport system permease component